MNQMIEHRIPVNKQASKVFWKAPWWAKLNEPDRQTIQEQASKWEEHIIVEYTKPPPYDANKPHQIIDKRGVKIVFPSGDVGILTGFHDEKRVSKLTNRSDTFHTWVHNGRVHSARSECHPAVVRRWWMLLNGEFRTINLMNRRKKWIESTDPSIRLTTTSHKCVEVLQANKVQSVDVV